jgi:hypothetical protein
MRLPTPTALLTLAVCVLSTADAVATEAEAKIPAGMEASWAGEKPFFDLQKPFFYALYSDDRGKTWWPSASFPEAGTGEAALAEGSCSFSRAER